MFWFLNTADKRVATSFIQGFVILQWIVLKIFNLNVEYHFRQTVYYNIKSCIKNNFCIISVILDFIYCLYRSDCMKTVVYCYVCMYKVIRHEEADTVMTSKLIARTWPDQVTLPLPHLCVYKLSVQNTANDLASYFPLSTLSGFDCLSNASLWLPVLYFPLTANVVFPSANSAVILTA